MINTYNPGQGVSPDTDERGPRVCAFRFLRGPNVHWHEPVVEALIAVDGCGSISDETMNQFLAQLDRWLPDVDVPTELDHDGAVARAVGQAALALQQRVEIPVTFATTEPGELTGTYRIAVAYREEDTVRAALETALRLVRAGLASEPFDLAGEIERLLEVADRNRLGPSAASIVAAAAERGIPALRLRRRGNLVQLGWGVHQKRIKVSATPGTSGIAVKLCKEKPVTNRLLRTFGVPVPIGRSVHSADQAWQAAQEIGFPVVIKPEAGNKGKGVSVGLETEEQVRTGYEVAESYILKGDYRGNVLVERYVEGTDHRLLVVNGTMVAAVRRDPAQVIGDGKRTVRQLVDIVNSDPRRRPKRSELSPILLDEVARLTLAQQNLTFDSIPRDGQVVMLRRNSNVSSGGTSSDVTDVVHPYNARMAELATRAVGLDVAGVDLLCHDISRRMDEQAGAIIEVNAAPGLRIHLSPYAGKPRQVGRPIVEMLFPNGAPGRIPVTVTLSTRMTGLGNLVARMYGAAYQFVGVSTPETALVGERRLQGSEGTQQANTQALLLDPTVEAIVVDTTPQTIVEEGLAIDRCQIAIVLDQEGSGADLERLQSARVLAEAVDGDGTLILNADEHGLVDLAGVCSSVIYTSVDPGNAAIQAHQVRGGRCVLSRNGYALLMEGKREVELMRMGQERPVAETLAAVAAGWAAGLPPAAIAQALTLEVPL